MKILILGRTSFLSREFFKFLKKKKISYSVKSLSSFLALDKKKIEKFNFLINFCVHKNYLHMSYNKKYDLDLKIINKIRDIKIKFVMLSSAKVYSADVNLLENSQKKPESNYGKNKLVTEKNISKSIKNFLIFRLSNIISPKIIKSKTSVTNTFFDIVRANFKQRKIIFPQKKTFKDFIFIDDFCKLLLLSLKKNLKGTYNLSSGKKTYLKKLALILFKITNFKISFIDSKTDSFILNNNKLIKKLKYKQKIKEVNLINLKKIL